MSELVVGEFEPINSHHAHRDAVAQATFTAGDLGRQFSDQRAAIEQPGEGDVKTPLECLVLLNENGLVTFKAGITLADLLAKASEKTDLQAAQEMQQAKAKLFELFNQHRCKQQA